jgi:hypothetical protein
MRQVIAAAIAERGQTVSGSALQQTQSVSANAKIERDKGLDWGLEL